MCERLKKSGIYKIVNTVNGKIYIGSAKSFIVRFRLHKSDLILNRHRNGHLQNAWNKYGKKNFKFIIIEVIENPTKKKLDSREQYWMNFYDVTNRDKGYNISTKAGSQLGFKHSEATKRKLSKIHKSKRFKPFIKRLIKSGYRPKHSKEERQKLSESLLKFYSTPLGKRIAREKGRKRIGRKVSKMTGQKISRELLKFFRSSRSKQVKLNLRKAHLGSKLSRKIKKKISLTLKRKYKNGTIISPNKDGWKKKVSPKVIIKLYLKGKSIMYIARKYHIRTTTVSKVLYKNKISVRKR